MNSLPECHQPIEAIGGSVQNLPHFSTLRIARANCIFAVGQGNTAIRQKIDDRFRLAEESMYVARRVIVAVNDELHTAALDRAHGMLRITQAP
jgi:hypothetical protein